MLQRSGVIPVAANTRRELAREREVGSSGTSSGKPTGAEGVPWLQPPAWVPPYAGLLNNLPALLRLRATPERWVTVFPLFLRDNRTGTPEDVKLLRIALNTIYSYQVYGKSEHYVVAAMTPAALQDCRRLRLPCYNATHYPATRTIIDIYWARLLVLRDVLTEGYHVHLSDLDIAYLRPAFGWSANASDGSMMREEALHKNGTVRFMVNGGCKFLLANERVVAFLDSLMPHKARGVKTQIAMGAQAYRTWAPCCTLASCTAAKAAGLAAITPHPNQFGTQHCAPGPGFRPCSPDLSSLYVHAICLHKETDKEAMLAGLDVMFLRRDIGGGLTGAQALRDPAVLGRPDPEAIRRSGLPCATGAWHGKQAACV
ncbi:hypothetical protein GPECTOR_39g494 [Gonium pectorale]|uniref:Nucleotide-diphospho-sugar transferase domain-containing protein n=1 Tax=Gonium pectorale TaxID=33097 RepID=A0A150GCD8_GONPE|nr:hypothetical protein GPECTOR_39g494 [Gonium pectorale]|eukprot:KXZ47000.1 hypothetical protein GPECTOR_39g494 [Gonium pectorale]